MKEKLKEYTYDRIDHDFRKGRTFRNLNGRRYRIIEKFSDKDFLVMDTKSGQFVMASDVKMFLRYPKDEAPNAFNIERGAEWSHGLYLGETLRAVNFNELNRRYGNHEKVMPNEDGSFDIEIQEILSRVENVKAGTLGEAIDKAMELYDKEQIVLGADDMKGVDFMPFDKNSSPKR